MSEIFWITTVLSLLLALPIFAFRTIQKRYPNAQLIWALTGAGILVTTILAATLDISFVPQSANVTWILGCYLSFCSLAASSFQVGNRLFRWAALLVAAIPIAFAATTVGPLGIMFVFADVLAKPSYTQSDAEGHICTVTGWGGAWGDSGYKGVLYKSWIALPFLKREVAWISVNQSTDSVARSYTVDLPAPIRERDFCAQLLSGAATQI